MMRSLKSGIAALAVATAGAAVLTATPASAHGAPFTVTAGPAPAGTSVPVTLTSGTFTWKDTTTHVTVACTSVTLRGAVVTGADNGRVGTIDAARSVFRSCTGPAGLKFSITGFGTWTLDATDSSSGVTAATVGNVRAHLVATAGPACAWDFAAPTGAFVSSGTATTDPGSLAASYSNSSTALSVPATDPGSLGLWNVRGGGANTYCVAASVWKQGDRMSWSATWKVVADAAANNPVAID